MLQGLYRALMELGGPALDLVLARRAAQGKEDRGRGGERRGLASRPRPPGPLVWCHAASVGEALSLLPLVERLAPRAAVLVTTGTTTSATLMAGRLPAGVIHQYVPVDRPSWVRAFYDHWQPDLALWVESELWPNLIAELQRRRIPAALVNGRMSARSFGRWRRVPGTARSLLKPFHVVLAQTGPDSERLAALGAAGVKAVGNLKFSASPLPDQPQRRAAFEQALGARPCWVMASTHPGEEEIAADIHANLQRRLPDLLTTMVPRHPERGAEVEAALRARKLALARRSAKALPAAGDDVYLVDTLGELGLFYRAIGVTVIGGTLVPHGGHNPIEPAQLGTAILYGPHMHNFAEIAAELEAAGGAWRISGKAELEDRLFTLLTEPATRRAVAASARAVADRHAAVIDAVMAELAPLLARAGIPA